MTVLGRKKKNEKGRFAENFKTFLLERKPMTFSWEDSEKHFLKSELQRKTNTAAENSPWFETVRSQDYE